MYLNIDKEIETFGLVNHDKYYLRNHSLIRNREDFERGLQLWWEEIRNKVEIHGLRQYDEGNSHDVDWEHLYFVSEKENYFSKYFEEIKDTNDLYFKVKKEVVSDCFYKDAKLYNYTNFYCSKDGIPFVIVPCLFSLRTEKEKICSYLIVNVFCEKSLHDEKVKNILEDLGLTRFMICENNLKNFR